MGSRQISLVALLFASLSMSNAHARSDTAVHGYARPADRACFQESWGTMLNTCSTTRQLFVPASIDKHCTVGGSYTVTAQSNTAGSNVCCRMISIDGQQIFTGAFTCLPAHGSPQTWPVNGAVPWADRFFYVCDVGPNAKVIGIDYSQNGGC